MHFDTFVVLFTLVVKKINIDRKKPIDVVKPGLTNVVIVQNKF